VCVSVSLSESVCVLMWVGVRRVERMTTMNTATDTIVDKDSILPLPMAWMIKPNLMVVDLMLSPAVTRLYACHMSSGSSGMRTTCLQEGSHHCEDEHPHPLHPLLYNTVLLSPR